MLYLIQLELVELGVNQQRFVPGGDNFIEAEEQFQRIVRLLAAEVGGAGEVPVGIDQRVSHAATSGACSRAVPGKRSAAGGVAKSSRFRFHQDRKSTRLNSSHP